MLEKLFPMVQACGAPNGRAEAGNPQLVAVCILTAMRTLSSTIPSYWCLSPPRCLKAGLLFSSMFFYFTCYASATLGDLALLDEELPCSIKLKVHLRLRLHL